MRKWYRIRVWYENDSVLEIWPGEYEEVTHRLANVLRRKFSRSEGKIVKIEYLESEVK